MLDLLLHRYIKAWINEFVKSRDYGTVSLIFGSYLVLAMEVA